MKIKKRLVKTALCVPALSGSTDINPISLTSVFGMGTGVSLLVWLALNSHIFKLFKALFLIYFMQIKLKNKKEAEKGINEFFSDIKNKRAKDIKKMKKLAMHYKIKLKDKRKVFCKYCYGVLKGKIRIRNKMKSVVCFNCRKINRWRIKTS